MAINTKIITCGFIYKCVGLSVSRYLKMDNKCFMDKIRYEIDIKKLSQSVFVDFNKTF